ncbi:hypothetical protein [Kitasatospora sp. NPDC090308]|uniref:hypothetical protein n=1 Tax=Kitasatospora sp. NPDC090308 TaxID=3364082 RepID=UPI0037F3C475
MTRSTPDEKLFATMVHALVGGHTWRALPPCFGVSTSTAYRRFLIRSSAGVRGRLHELALDRLDDADPLDISRMVLDFSHGRTGKGKKSQVRAHADRETWLPERTFFRALADCPSSLQLPLITSATGNH